MKKSTPTVFFRHQETCNECSKIHSLPVSFLLSKKANTYSEEILNYLQLQAADALIVCNKKQKLSKNDCLDILFAIEKNKHIIMLDVPKFEKEVVLFIQEIILDRLSKVSLLDVTQLDEEDANIYFGSLTSTPVNYTLTHHQRTLIRAIHKLHFRELEKVDN